MTVLAPENSGLTSSSTSVATKSRERDLFEFHLDARFRDQLRRFFRRRRQTETDCDDLIQETFAKALQQPEVHQAARPAAYIFTIAANLLRDRGRRQAVRREQPLAGHLDGERSFLEVVDEEPGAERILTAKDELNRVMQAILEMPERTQTIFTLCRLEAMPHREVAARLGISVSAVEKHVAKALLHIARQAPA